MYVHVLRRVLSAKQIAFKRCKQNRSKSRKSQKTKMLNEFRQMSIYKKKTKTPIQKVYANANANDTRIKKKKKWD